MLERRRYLRYAAALYALFVILVALLAFLPALALAALISGFEDTWTDGGTNYLIHGNVTDTSSAADSQLLGLSVGGTDKFYVLKDGTITVTGPIVSLANGDITLTPNGTGHVVASGAMDVFGGFNIGDPGLESGSIQLNGASFTAVTKINDFGSTPDAELVLHRHSTTDANQLLLVRSHSNDSSHGDVLDTDDIGEIMFGGWNTASYYLGARIRAQVNGTPGVGDMPTSLLFQVAADGTANPTTALTISPDKTATFAGTVSTPELQVATDSSNYCKWVSAADGALTLSCFGTDADYNIDLSGATDGDFSVNTDDLFVDTSTGRVGIGSVSPGGLLDLKGDSADFTIVQADDRYSAAIRTTGSGEAIFYLWANDATGSSANAKVYFSSYPGDDNWVNNGSFGVHTTTPSNLVDVDGGTSYGAIELDGGTGGCIMLRDTDDAGWTECTALNGTLSCSTDADGVCDGS